MEINAFYGGSDAGDYFKEYEMPVCVFGPGSLEQAHQPNEWISIESLIYHYEIIKRILVDAESL
jgi:succinyl-diaminopimelate desuccinylase